MATFAGNPAASALNGTEIVPLTQGGVDKRTTVQGIADANESKSSDIASAATTDLSTATTPFVHVTGTTTITALGTAQAGAQRQVVFDGALTLTHNGTSLILPTGADITTAAGDAAIFRSEGSGNWRCVGYQRKSGEPLAGGGGSGTVETIVAGTGISVDNTDPANPIVTATGGGGSTTLSIVTEASTSTMAPATHAGLNKYVRAADDVTFNTSESYTAGEVYNIRATSALTLIGTGVTLTAPAGGTLALDAAMSVTVVMTSSSAGDVIGQTVPA